jgi:hypothetical protein
MTKTEINKVLKNIGFGFVKMQVNTYQDKTHPSKTKGLRGGSIGPMTATDAYMNHNQSAINETKTALTNIGGKVESSYNDLSISFPSKKGKLVYNFNLNLFKTYAGFDLDPSYKTYWLTVNSEEI